MSSGSSWWVQRKLRRNSAALTAARDELRIAEEQSLYLPEDDPQLEATDRFRATLRERIVRLEAEQDELLDRLGSASS